MKYLNTNPEQQWILNTALFEDKFEKKIRSHPRELSTEMKKIITPEGVTLFLCYPKKSTKNPLPVIYYIHGGGLLAGNASDDQEFMSQLANSLNCCLVSVEYRLAPEHSYPIPLNDCLSGLEWIFSQPSNIFNLSKVIIMGFSAGGGLAAALTQMWSDNKKNKPLLAQYLIYPMLDPFTGIDEQSEKKWTHQGKYIWTAKMNQYAWKSYLKYNSNEDVDLRTSLYASPIAKIDLDNLPQCYICIGALDLFLDEGIRYASNLLQCGVNTRLEIIPGQPHSFDKMKSIEAERFKERLIMFLNDHLN